MRKILKCDGCFWLGSYMCGDVPRDKTLCWLDKNWKNKTTRLELMDLENDE